MPQQERLEEQCLHQQHRVTFSAKEAKDPFSWS